MSSRTRNLAEIILIVAYFIYISLAGVYKFFPPLIGLLFVKYVRDLRGSHIFGVVAVFAMSIIYESIMSATIGLLFLLFVFLGFVFYNLSKILDSDFAFFLILYVTIVYFSYFFVLQITLTLESSALLRINWAIFLPIILESVILLWRK